jgi:hypothetical protein
VVARLAEFHGPASAPASPAKTANPETTAQPAVTLIDDRTGERLVLRLADVRQARLEVELPGTPHAR